jgi:TetR/AcrR family transcriptional regulator, transcriptional repressor for nem operon
MQAPVKGNVRTRLIQAAVELTHRHGFGNTTLADIAREAKVPPGNLYYYFKTKEEIAEAIVELRLSELSAVQQELGKIESPRERLCSLVLLWLKDRETIAKYGCPIGTFCSELNKDGSVPAKKASKIFADLLVWVEAQFREFCPKGQARGHAVHLVSVLEGVTVLANCSKNPDLMEMESKRLMGWIRSI